jgi:YD repeat-containing protein
MHTTKNKPDDIIEFDKDGNLVLEKRPDGFEERITYYDNGKIATVETKYPNGIIECERYARN